MFVTIIVFVLILALLVLIHEFGHFIVAKKSGMVVHEFGFGFPPRIFGIQKSGGKWKMVWGAKSNESDETVYSVNWIPLGGFVKIMGENNEHENNPQSFINKPFWPRFFTLVAGVVMNWFLAAVLFSLIFAVGFRQEVDLGSLPPAAIISEARVVIADVMPGGPAAQAGLKSGDQITAVDGRSMVSAEAIKDYLISHKGQTFNFTVKRVSGTENISVKSLASPPQGQGPTGIAVSDEAFIRFGVVKAVEEGFAQTVFITGHIVSYLGQLFHSKEALNQIGGPVKIAQLVGTVRRTGVMPLINLTAFLSINLAILNILPLPALDGGRILFLIIEKIRGKKNNQRVEQLVNTVGFVCLLLLMLLVTIKDVRGF